PRRGSSPRGCRSRRSCRERHGCTARPAATRRRTGRWARGEWWPTAAARRRRYPPGRARPGGPGTAWGRSFRGHYSLAVNSPVAVVAPIVRDPGRARGAGETPAELRQLVESLPVTAHRDAIVAALRSHPVVIVSGETGSGKTTQLPKLCLEAGRGRADPGTGRGGIIGHTQPRRLAATSVAQRIAQELGTPLGVDVGYRIRFGEKVSKSARIKLMTDGILLAETQSDPLLSRYDTVIVDEAHERSLNIDFLLGYLKRLVDGPRRDDLKVVITSATIDAARFARHFA